MYCSSALFGLSRAVCISDARFWWLLTLAYHSRMVGLICFMTESPQGMRIPPYSTAFLGVLDRKEDCIYWKNQKARALERGLTRRGHINCQCSFGISLPFEAGETNPGNARSSADESSGTESSHSGRCKTSVTRRGISQENL